MNLRSYFYSPLRFPLLLRCPLVLLSVVAHTFRPLRGSDNVRVLADLRAATAFAVAASSRSAASVSRLSASACCSVFHNCCSTLRISRHAWLMFRHRCSS
uniref:Putative secreted protein n=1 Tax=Anopheles triannulatus TaxID=58253 RepID=A0A2M4B4J8_9DIPT